MDLKMVTNLMALWKWIVEEEKEKPQNRGSKQKMAMVVEERWS